MRDEEIRRLRRAVGWLPAGNGRRYSAELKAAIRRAAEKQRLAGASWNTIARMLGIPTETLRGFVAAGGRKDNTFVAVEVAGEAPTRRELTVTTASGERVEGLDVESAAMLLRLLR